MPRMTDTVREIMDLEEQLRIAELGPDPEFFDKHLADEAILDGQRAKAKVVDAHRPTGTAKFTRVEMSDFDVIDHGDAAVVMCKGIYTGATGSVTLRFMRVWLRSAEGWKIIARTVAQ
jgi:hypothetical protein